MCVHRLYALFITLCVLSSADYARADFIKSTSLNYVSTSNTVAVGTASVSILPTVGASEHPTGIIIGATDAVIPAQLFNPSKLKGPHAGSFFLKYSAEKHSYVELVIPNGKSFSIEGNVSIRIGETLRVSISTENGVLPFVSIIHTSDPHSVLALLGTDVITGGSGGRLESYLDAGVRNATEVFEVKGSKLLLQGVEFSDPKIGLPNQAAQTHSCLNRVVMVSHGQYLEFQRAGQSGEVLRQVKAIQKGEDPGVLQKYTILNVLQGALVAVDGYGKLVVISEEKERASDIPVCSINDLIGNA